MGNGGWLSTLGPKDLVRAITEPQFALNSWTDAARAAAAAARRLGRRALGASAESRSERALKMGKFAGPTKAGWAERAWEAANTPVKGTPKLIVGRDIGAPARKIRDIALKRRHKKMARAAAVIRQASR